MKSLCSWLARGQRASDRRIPAPARPRPDRALAAAIGSDSIVLAFQPQFEVATGQIVGVEALSRWTGCGSPEELFARAGRANLAERLSRAVQRKALRTVGSWTGPLGKLRVAINLLAEDLARPGYGCWLLREIAAAGLSPERVTAEITEGSLVADRVGASAQLAQLRSAGVRIAVDDFGTGYTNLAYLTSLPLDTLKIDRSLIANIGGEERDRIVVRAMIGLARELGLQVVVEGVEDSAQLALLAGWGCDLYQGFLQSAPLREQELIRFVGIERAAA
ncbi:EAL domain-containing protein [Sphingomonas sp. GCM10030256]|uniref:EAL domain-containing protein n=1 Tax=Sphingomonas sp. GCM10030256 TaxID=3273427 RepID=UPI0036151610